MMRNIPDIQEKTAVDIEIFEDSLIVKKALPEKALFPYKEAELLANFDTLKSHSELLANPLAHEIE